MHIELAVAWEIPSSDIIREKHAAQFIQSERCNQPYNGMDEPNDPLRLRTRDPRIQRRHSLRLLHERPQPPLILLQRHQHAVGLRIATAPRDLPRQHVRADERAARAHARNRRRAERGVPEQHHSALGPRIHLDLAHLLRVEVLGASHALQDARALPPAALEDHSERLVLRRRALAQGTRQRRAVRRRHQVRLQRARVVAARGHGAAARGVVDGHDVGVARLRRDGEVRGAEAQRREGVGRARAQQLPPRARVLPVRAHHQVEWRGAAVRERHAHGRGALLEAGDGGAEDVRGLLLRAVVQDAAEVAAHDLELGGGALLAGASLISRDECLAHAGAVDEPRALLVDHFGAHFPLDAHLLHHRDALAAEVDLLAAVPQAVEPLHDGDVVVQFREPEGQGGPGYAAADDEYSEACHVVCFSGWKPIDKLRCRLYGIRCTVELSTFGRTTEVERKQLLTRSKSRVRN